MRYLKLLVIPLVLVVICAFLLHAAYVAVNNKTIDQLNELQRMLAKEAALGLEGYFNDCRHRLKTLSEMKDVIRWNDQGKDLLQMFHRMSEGDIEVILRTDAEGRVVHCFPEGSSAESLARRNIPGGAPAGPEPVVSDPLFAEDGWSGISIRVPVLEDDTYTGSLIVLIRLDRLAERYLGGIKIGKDGYAWVIDRQGVELYCPVPGHVGKSVFENCRDFPAIITMAKAMTEGQSGVTTYSFDHIRGELTTVSTKHAVFRPVRLGGTFWSVVVATPENEVLGIIDEFRNTWSYVVGVLLVGAGVWLYYLTRAFLIVEEEKKRRVAEQALRDSEVKYRTLFESARAAICIIQDWKFVDANESARALLGIREGMDFDSAMENLSPCGLPGGGDSRQLLRERIRTALATGAPETFELRFLRGDGTRLDMYASVDRLELGTQTLVQAIIRDITAYKQAIEATEKSERLLHRIIQASPNPTFVIGKDHRVLYWNAALEKFSGIGSEDMVGTNRHWSAFYEGERPCMADLLLDEDLEEFSKRYGHAARKSDLVAGAFEATPFLPNLGTGGKWLRVTAGPVRDSRGAIVGAVQTVQDITERKLAELALQQEKEFSDTLIDVLPGMFFVLDTEGRFVRWNRVVRETIGTSDEQMDGLDALIPVLADDRHIIAGAIRNVFERGYADATARVITGKNEVRHFYFSGKRIVIGKNTFLLATGLDITERQQAEDALISANQQLYDIIEFLPDATLVLDNGKRVIAWNRAIETMTGVSKKDMIGKGDNACMVPLYGGPRPHLPDLIDVGDDELESKYRYVKRAGNVVYAETFLPCVYDGKGAYVMAKAAPLFDAHGNRVGVIESIRDITEYKQAEEALRESRRQLADIIDFLPNATFVIDREGRVIAWNRAIEEMTGVNAADMLGRGDYEYALPFYGKRRPILIDLVLHPSGQAGAAYSKIGKGGTVFEAEEHTPTLRGRGAYLIGTASVLRDSKGNIVGAIESLRDITERKRMEEALARAEEKYRSIFENALEGIFQTTPEGRFLSVNPSLARILGYGSPEETIRSVTDLSRQVYVDPERRLELLQLTMERGIVQDFEIQVQRKDRSLAWIKISLRGVRDHSGRLVYMEGTAQDITDRKVLESRLLQAQKIEAIGTLAGGIAHDFNNILAAIIGYTEMTRQTVEHPDPRRYLDQVLKACDRARNLVGQILAFSRKAEREIRPVDVRSIVKEALKFLRATLSSTIKIRQKIAPGTHAVLADPTQIHQVLINLCTNAAHAMREKGGVLQVDLENIDVRPGSRAFPSDLPSGPYLKLTISDTGTGIDHPILHRIFDPFFTTKRPGEGTGLGLSVVYGIVKECGGTVTVSSEPGAGSVFSVCLPALVDGVEAALEPVEPVPTGSERILFVDDERVLVELARTMLTALGYTVTATCDSIKAFEIFKNRADEFDLIITDLTMPRLTGVELARAILAMRPEIPVILCTGYTEMVTEEEVKQAGIRQFVMKPLNTKNVARLIRRVLDGGNA